MTQFNTPRPWWSQDIHRDRRPLLLTRNRIKSALRAWFEAREYIEVETACLQVSPGNEIHLQAFETEVADEAGVTAKAYLHTSPEFACKKLLAAGEKRIFTFAPVFRNGERSRLHEPEFIMLEWYRSGARFGDLLDDCEALVQCVEAATGNQGFQHLNRRASGLGRSQRLSVCQAFLQHAGIDLAGHLATGADRDTFAQLAIRRGHRVADDDDWSDIFTRVLTADVEPKLGIVQPTLLTHYPISEAALAKPTAADPRFAERAELYICGVEVANGFAELTDAREQSRRFERDMAEKKRRYGYRHPIDSDFIAALDQMPQAVGCALGFDRLVMLATGAPCVRDVIWTPVSNFQN